MADVESGPEEEMVETIVVDFGNVKLQPICRQPRCNPKRYEGTMRLFALTQMTCISVRLAWPKQWRTLASKTHSIAGNHERSYPNAVRTLVIVG